MPLRSNPRHGRVCFPCRGTGSIGGDKCSRCLGTGYEAIYTKAFNSRAKARQWEFDIVDNNIDRVRDGDDPWSNA